jgi:hypothetical protein
MDLTEDEVARIRAAYRDAADMAAWEGYAVEKARGERPALVKFIDAWDRLDVEERAAVSFELARLISPDGDVDPHDLDVGLAAFLAAEAGRGRRGTPTRNPGFNAAVAEAVRVWSDRGRDVTRVNVWRDQGDDRDARPLLAFVADAIEAAVPADAIARATGMRRPDRAKFLQSIEARLRP